MNELVAAVRHGKVERVKEILADGSVDVNALCPVTARVVTIIEPGSPDVYAPDASEAPLYPSHALFEATRSGNEEIVDLLLAHPATDPNVCATETKITTLADCVARGHTPFVSKLLDHSSIDVHAGSEVVASPLLYACKYGHKEIVDLFLGRKLAEFGEEEALKEEAARNGNPAIIEALRVYFLTKRSFEEMELEEKVERLRFEFDRADTNHNDCIDRDELMEVAAALGNPLTFEEASEALIAMDTDGSGKVRLDELIAFWVGVKIE